MQSNVTSQVLLAFVSVLKDDSGQLEFDCKNEVKDLNEGFKRIDLRGSELVS